MCAGLKRTGHYKKLSWLRFIKYGALEKTKLSTVVWLRSTGISI